MIAVTSNVLQYRQKHPTSVHIETTLYDLIKAVSEEVRPEEQHLVTPVVQELLSICRAN